MYKYDHTATSDAEPGGLNVDEELYYITTDPSDGRCSASGDIIPTLLTHRRVLSTVVFDNIEFDMRKQPGCFIIPTLAQMCNLSEIEFSRCRISTETWSVIGLTLCQLSASWSNLSTLSITYPDTFIRKSDGLTAMLMAVSAITDLVSIQLTLPNIDHLVQAEKEAVFRLLERSLSGRTSLLHLKLASTRGEYVDFMDDVRVGRLVGTLCSSSRLQSFTINYLSISLNAVSVGTAEAALRNGPTLCPNQYWHGFWRYLNSSVCHLTSLNLKHNGLTSDGWNILVNGLMFNQSLTFLGVSHNPINSAGIPTLRRLLSEHRTGPLTRVHYSMRKCITVERGPWGEEGRELLNVSSLRAVEGILCGDPPPSMMRSRVNHTLQELARDNVLRNLINHRNTDLTSRSILFNIELSLRCNRSIDTSTGVKQKLLGRLFPVILEEVRSTKSFHFVEKVLELVCGSWSRFGEVDRVTSYKNDDFTDIVPNATFVSMTYTTLTTCTGLDENTNPFIIILLSRRDIRTST